MNRIILLVLFSATLFAQEKEDQDVWEPMRYFVGAWDGDEDGVAGKGVGDRTYAFILNNRFLHYKNTSTFAPQEKNPEGEVHQDWGFFSYDSFRKTFVIRVFYVEGFVNQFVLDSLSADGKTWIFLTESVENGPPGLRARYTITIHDAEEFAETFAIAFPGKEFKNYLRNRWTRRE